MKRFHFSLAKVQKLREQALKEAELALARVNARLMEAEGELSVLAQSASLTRAELYTGSAADMMRSQNFLLRLDKEKEELFKRMAEIQLELEQKRAAWIKARSENQALEKLREKKGREHRKENLAIEGDELDDISNSRSSDPRVFQNQ